MTLLRANLIRGRVLPPRRRKTLYWGILTYLGLCGVLLVAVVHMDTYRMLEALRARRKSESLLEAFHAQHPDQKDLVAYAHHLRQRLVSQIDRIRSVEEVVERRAHASQLLLGIAAPLPDDITVEEFRLDGRTGRLSIILKAPEAQARSAADLISAWNTSSNLVDEAEGFRILSRSQSASQDGGSVVTLEVEGKLKTGRSR